MKIVSDNPKFLKELNKQLNVERIATKVELKESEEGSKSATGTIAWVVVSKLTLEAIGKFLDVLNYVENRRATRIAENEYKLHYKVNGKERKEERLTRQERDDKLKELFEKYDEDEIEYLFKD
jgi:hypothetical protein